MRRIIPNLDASSHGGRPVWDDIAAPGDLALLESGTGGWNESPDVLVAGGGIVGLAVAVFCTRAGMRVLLVERDRLAGRASGRAAGGLSPDVHPELGPRWRELARSSLALHRELDREWGYGLRDMSVRVAPDLRVPGQAHVDPVRLSAAFTRAAGMLRTNTEMTDVAMSDGRVVTVDTTAGTVRPEWVVFATGTSPMLAPDVCATLVKGHLIATEPVSFALHELVTDGEILVVQLADGRLVAGGTKDRNDDGDAVDDAVVARIERRMADLVPETVGIGRTHAWTCFRPCTSDELPVVDLVADNAVLVTGLYSTGLLMAPILGRLVSSWITGDRPAQLEGFGFR